MPPKQASPAKEPLKYCPQCFHFMPLANQTCPKCGLSYPSKSSSLYLNPRLRLRKRYLVGKVLGHGGFGVTYLGYNMQGEKRVAIKEFFPREHASRLQNSSTIMALAGQSNELFQYGKQRFVEEARFLSKFHHPNIVKIMDLMEAFGTVYFVMEYLDGVTVSEHVKENGPLGYTEVRQIVLQLLDALEEVHSLGILHRDINPRNLLLVGKQQKPVLIDFGSARQQTAHVSHSLSVIIAPHYAPIEQYTRHGQQGPYTDIYALAATAYFMLTGNPPPEPQEQMIGNRKLVAPSLQRRDIRPEDEAWLLKALEIKKEDRPQTVQDWRRLILPYQVKLQAPPSREITRKPKTSELTMQLGQQLGKQLKQGIPTPSHSVWMVLSGICGLLVLIWILLKFLLVGGAS